ncbi:chromosome partitioning protein [Streptacidiphilus sp. MAP12-20]|uniref:ParA family protein n=1 Tax=Streptacidiphilus sp. MAP12-20 TaxID=3156299 RepID=UPI0035186267
MADVTVVLNQKGGIGKSTISVNLSATIAEVVGRADDELAPVAAVSVDPQGSAVWWAERVGDDLPFVFTDAYDDLAGIQRLREVTSVRHAIIDTPGWMTPDARRPGADPLGKGPIADAVRAALDAADFVIVPLEPEPMGFEPTQNTIERIIKPRGIPYLVVISNWDPRDGTVDLEDTKAFVRAQGWPLARTVIRHYKLHSRAAADRQVVTRYPKSRVSQEAQKDFLNLALEHQLMLADARKAVSA